ncbi:hypothetical protein [Paenibacillus mucilaginosus]|uniref:Uncharacterized protein n=3 Tax=Paenibacillus mucilaginosus TaxID=61624 RepID=H6NN47_9BACL|nr:hypothetical protein [Paenibacillus mucilaginosus]AEI44171.1 hypothetical protein KNP414_05647 [Paenibacillus mucilaginosus KNP414]AFC31723.1 hypothetical protein PM3016_4991 [Paenibacillus mucilaginosus 3016]AFH64075.1 hypothetical protein B2K_25885 [Paenibacillus mucilaginosus K02]
MGSNKTFHQKQQAMAAESNNAAENEAYMKQPYHKDKKEMGRPTV